MRMRRVVLALASIACLTVPVAAQRFFDSGPGARPADAHDARTTAASSSRG